MKQRDIEIGMIVDSLNCGSFIVLKRHPRDRFDIKFLVTGYDNTVCAKAIITGQVKDKYHPLINGIGYIGEGIYSHKNDKKAYNTWKAMLERCYKEKRSKKNESYKDCYVNDYFHNFQNFADWHYKNYPSDGGSYQLDKDILFDGNREYHPEKCIYVTAKQNSIKAHEKRMKPTKVVDPDGNIHTVINQHDFASIHGFHVSGINGVITGRLTSYKGWTRI